MTDTNIDIALLGFFLDLRRLRRLLSVISRGDHIWLCPQTVSEEADWITIRYSNPIYGRTLPNQIVCRFPLYHDETSCFPVDERTYVCLSPDVAEEIYQPFKPLILIELLRCILVLFVPRHLDGFELRLVRFGFVVGEAG
jgi:hypothetical protein